MRHEKVSLLAFIFLLFTIITDKELLASISLGASGFSLYNIFILAVIIFGFIFYINLLGDTIKSIADVWKNRVISHSLIVNLIVLLTLIVLPLGSILLASGEWLNERYCTYQTDADPFDPFASVGTPYEYCPSNLRGIVFPAVVILLLLIIISIFIYRNYQNNKKVDPILRGLRAQIAELRIFQAVAPSNESIEAIQKEINKLAHDFKLREAAISIKRSKRK